MGQELPLMARPLRIHYPGAVYHIMPRSSRGQEVFADDQPDVSPPGSNAAIVQKPMRGR